ncbi:unnamed protein product [Litomosoides sigmodontis]|uniref:ShKT domain-containing protein n=1 Tax=Litomosoides sigmodontis TaxID=42156 RepID=A0A3P6UJJ2_LITSI|nr:unnamed protein product [Litomosoides sigmodontis]
MSRKAVELQGLIELEVSLSAFFYFKDLLCRLSVKQLYDLLINSFNKMSPFILLALLINAPANCRPDNGISRSRDASSACYDKDPDCSSDICKNYPYTAKERCPKFCGLCSDTVSGSSARPSSQFLPSSSQRQSLALTSGAVEKERKSLTSCTDKDSDCTAEICRNYPFTARERCAKTCGRCSDDVAIGSGSTTAAHRSTAFGVEKFKGGSASSSLSPRIGNALISGSLCFDRKFDCSREICRDFPFTARQECAKTCGFCSVDTSISSSSSNATLRVMSPSVEIGGSSGGTSSHRTAKQDSYEANHNIPAYPRLSRGEELECVDVNIDCTQQTCKDYPFTARERCAKTCGFCRKGSVVEERHSSLPAAQGNKATAITKECKDEDSQCSERSCLEHPYKASRKCAKTCGFCGEKSSYGSVIELESPIAASSDEGSVIALDSDGNDGSSTRSTMTSERRLTSGSGDTMSMQKPKHSSIRGRTDPIRSSSSASTAHIQQPTNKQYLGTQRYPGRTGPCTDANQLCEKADCYKYPNFSQKYCEKTCNYC